MLKQWKIAEVVIRPKPGKSPIAILEEKIISFIIFQAFDKVLNTPHNGLDYKLERGLSRQNTKLLTSYILHKLFRVKSADGYSELETSVGVLQGSFLRPLNVYFLH